MSRFSFAQSNPRFGKQGRSVDRRLQYLVLEAWEHDHPPGPETNLDIQDREREEWIETLTAEDCLAMARWLTNPVVPDEWGVGAHWHEQLAYGLTYYVGKAGRRHGDARLVDVVAVLIRQPASRELGLACAKELSSPALFTEVFRHLGDPGDKVSACLALAASSTSAQVEQLRALAQSSEIDPGIRAVVVDAIAEWESGGVTRQAEPVAAPDPAT